MSPINELGHLSFLFTYSINYLFSCTQLFSDINLIVKNNVTNKFIF